MAMHVSTCFSVSSVKRVSRVRAVVSENLGTLKVEEETVKLGASDLKVSRIGIGAWSWGDTSYWNDFDWNGITSNRKIKKNPLHFGAYFF